MSYVLSNRKFLFMLMDDQGRSYYRQNGVTKKSSVPSWVSNTPNGWKDITFTFATNQKYLSTNRVFSNAIKFVRDGMEIIIDRFMNGANTEEVMYLAILKNNPSVGLNRYDLEYKSRLDFSNFNPDTRTGVSMDTLQDDVFAVVQAKDTVNYSLQCNSTNPKAIKVLFDGTLLQDKANYTTPQVTITSAPGDTNFAFPLSFLNNEGDSVGAIFNSQDFDSLMMTPFRWASNILNPSNSSFILQFTEKTDVNAAGNISFGWSGPSDSQFAIYFLTDIQAGLIQSGAVPFEMPAGQIIFSNTGFYAGSPDPTFPLVTGKTYSNDFNMDIPLAASEKLFLVMQVWSASGAPQMFVLPTSVYFRYATKQVASVNYAIRPIDALQDLVSQITNGKYSADSNFLRNNNRKVMLSGSSLRDFPDAQVLTNFSDFFKSYSSSYNLGVTVRNGVMWIEPISDIYSSVNEILNLGEVSEASLSVAKQFIYNSAKAGYIKQTYNKRNGRYEYNCTHNYNFPIFTVINSLDLISPYRADSFGMEFIRTGYPDLTSTDDKGDGDVFTVMISDEVGQTTGEISNAVAVTIETLILASPVIISPNSGSTVYNAFPTINGKSQPFKTITVYADGTIDGTTVSDANGNWSYQLANALQSVSDTFNGVHVITANAQTDQTNISGFSKPLSLTVNTSATSAFLFTSPTNNDSLYNNLPLLSGIAPAARVITIKVDGATIGTATANTSGIWQFQVTVPLGDGAHVITATTTGGTPDAPALNINVSTSVTEPLITSLAYGDIIYNNLPLIKGIAAPAATVSIYIDGGGGAIVGGIAGPVGTTVADANGDWSFQVVSVIDSSGNTTDYIPDGLHIIATTATPVEVLASISGYRLMRGSDKGPVMDYDAIKLDDQYIPTNVDPSTLPPTLGQFLHPETLYNIEETTPLRMLRAHDNILMPFLKAQAGQSIAFNGAEANPNLTTKKNGVVFNEGASVAIADLQPPIWWPWILNFKAVIPKTFNQIMTSINNDGYISLSVKGIPIKCLPMGTMTVKPCTDEAQTWKVMVSGQTPWQSLVDIFSNSLSINIGKNMAKHSNKNPLHFVKYNFTPAAGYHFLDQYDDWVKHRFPSWIAGHQDYKQPWQKSDVIYDSFFTNGAGSVEAHLISCTTGLIVDTIPYDVVSTPLVPLPNVMIAVSIPLEDYPEDDYWVAVFSAGSYVVISEKLSLKADQPNTFLYEYGGSDDTIDYILSAGAQPMLRCHSRFMPWEPVSEVDIYEDDQADYLITRAMNTQKRVLQIGNDESLVPEWMSIKIDAVTCLSRCRVDNIGITRSSDSKLEKQDVGNGNPLGLYKMEVVLAENELGAEFAFPGDDSVHTTIIAIDGAAVGLNGQVINVTTTEN